MTSSNGIIFHVSGPFVRGIHRSPVDSPHKCQWCGALTFSLICAWTNGSESNRYADDLKRHCAHYDVTVMASHPHVMLHTVVCTVEGRWLNESLRWPDCPDDWYDRPLQMGGRNFWVMTWNACVTKLGTPQWQFFSGDHLQIFLQKFSRFTTGD